MAEFTVGQASILLVPSFKGFAEAIDAESARWGDSAGGTFGDTFSARASESTKDAIGDQDADAAAKGDSAGGKFADTFKLKIDAALKSLPDLKIDADNTDVDEKLAFIRAELTSLGNKEIGVDLTDDEALAKIAFLQAALTEIGRKSVQVKVDTGDATLKLAALKTEIDAATSGGGTGGGGSIFTSLGSDAAGAGFSIGNVLVPALVLLGTALIPIAGLAAGALATLPAIFAGLGSGVGAVALGFSGILPAVTAYRATLNTAGETTAQIATKQRDLVNALAGLTPAGQQFVQFVGSQLLPIFDSIKTRAQEALLPGITSGLQALEPVFTIIGNNIVTAAKGIGDFFNQLGHLLGTKSSLSDLNKIFGAGAGFMKDLAKAVLDVTPAFLKMSAQAAPILKEIGKLIDEGAKSFAKWVENGGFQKFLTWLKDNGPGIVKDIGALAKGIGGLIVALEPVGAVILNIIVFLVRVVTYWADGLRSMYNDAVNLWHGLDNDVVHPIVNFFSVTLPHAIDVVVGFFAALPGRIIGAVGNLAHAAFGTLENVASWVDNNVINPFVSEIGKLPGQIGDIGGKIVSGIVDGIKNAAGALARAVTDIIPHGTLHIGPVSIPYAQGGIVNVRTNAVIGEDGPEAVLPLNKPDRMAQILAQIAPLLPSGAIAPLPSSAFGSAGVNSGPAMNVENQNFYSGTDVVALGQQLSFLRRAAVL